MKSFLILCIVAITSSQDIANVKIIMITRKLDGDEVVKDSQSPLNCDRYSAVCMYTGHNGRCKSCKCPENGTLIVRDAAKDDLICLESQNKDQCNIYLKDFPENKPSLPLMTVSEESLKIGELVTSDNHDVGGKFCMMKKISYFENNEWKDMHKFTFSIKKEKSASIMGVKNFNDVEDILGSVVKAEIKCVQGITSCVKFKFAGSKIYVIDKNSVKVVNPSEITTPTLPTEIPTTSTSVTTLQTTSKSTMKKTTTKISTKAPAHSTKTTELPTASTTSPTTVTVSPITQQTTAKTLTTKITTKKPVYSTVGTSLTTNPTSQKGKTTSDILTKTSTSVSTASNHDTTKKPIKSTTTASSQKPSAPTQPSLTATKMLSTTKTQLTSTVPLLTGVRQSTSVVKENIIEEKKEENDHVIIIVVVVVIIIVISIIAAFFLIKRHRRLKKRSDRKSSLTIANSCSEDYQQLSTISTKNQFDIYLKLENEKKQSNPYTEPESINNINAIKDKQNKKKKKNKGKETKNKYESLDNQTKNNYESLSDQTQNKNKEKLTDIEKANDAEVFTALDDNYYSTTDQPYYKLVYETNTQPDKKQPLYNELESNNEDLDKAQPLYRELYETKKDNEETLPNNKLSNPSIYSPLENGVVNENLYGQLQVINDKNVGLDKNINQYKELNKRDSKAQDYESLKRK